MSYYKMGCAPDNGLPVRVTVQQSLLRERLVGAEMSERIGELAEPWPTLILWALLSVGAILWVKGGGGLGIL